MRGRMTEDGRGCIHHRLLLWTVASRMVGGGGLLTLWTASQMGALDG